MPQTLLVTNDFGPRAGGIETFLIGLLERLPNGEVVVYTSKQDDTKSYDAAWLAEHGVRVYRDRSRVLLPTPRVVRALRKIIRDEGITRVWFGAAAPLGISARWLRIEGVTKIFAMTHGHELWWAKLPPFSWALRFASRSIDHFTYLGGFTASALRRVIPAGKLIRIAPGIDTKNFAPRDSSALRSELGLAKVPTIISVGRLVHRKGQDRLIQALPKIKERIGAINLIFVGEGPYEKRLRKITEELGVGNEVHFLGRVQYSRLAEYFSLGDVFVMPCRSRAFGLEVEGLGIVFLEASATGLPVIAGDSGGAPDALLAGETGLLVPGNDLDAIAEAAITLLEDPNLRAQYGKRGREWILSDWDWAIWSERFNKLLMQ